jgi:nicotinamidase-related amidase
MPSSDADNRPATGSSALLIVDMISRWDFPDAEKLVVGAASIAESLKAFKARCKKAGIPIIYANDNQGQWRSDFKHLVDRSLEAGGQGAQITRMLMPDADDYFVLKPKHSAFLGTPLEMLLQHLKVNRILVTGVASDQCVLVTAIEGRMRDLSVHVPCDCVASQTHERNVAVLRQLEEAHSISTACCADVAMSDQPQAAPAQATTTGK